MTNNKMAHTEHTEQSDPDLGRKRPDGSPYHMRSVHMIKCMVTAVCTALCVVLPIALHAIPNAGTLLSPMHLPVLLCGMACGWQYGLACGLMGPMLSSFITGMPGIGYLPTMMVELAVYGLVTGLMMRLIHTGKQLADIYISLLTAMLAGRILTGAVRGLIFSAGNYSWKAWATGYFVSSFPGILVQLILIPVLYLALQRAHLAPVRSRSGESAQ